MNKLTKLTLSIAFALFATVACQKDDAGIAENSTTTPSQTDEVTFQSEITKASGTYFEQGDTISVIAYEGDSIKFQNIEYSYSNDLFSSSTPIRYENDNQLLSYRAVYPYISIPASGDFSFSVCTDQSIGNNYTRSDLMSSYASPTNTPTPTLAFDHLLSRIVLNITESDIPLDSVEAYLYVYNTVQYNLFTRSYTTSGFNETIRMAVNGTDGFKAIIPPQLIYYINIPCYIVVNGATYGSVTLSNKQFAAGIQYSYNLKIRGGDIEISEAEILDWAQGSTENDLDNTSNYITWDGTTADFTQGDGTEFSPYIIETPSQLAKVAELTNNNSSSAYTYYKVADNSAFDMDNIAWTPIGGNYSNQFYGNFNGNGVVIKNLNITGSEATYLAMFGYVSSSTISGINLKYSSITNSLNSSTSYVAAIAAYVTGESSSKSNILDCTVIGSSVETIYNDTYNKSNRAAAIVATADYTLIENCHVNSSSVTISGTDSGSTAGGIVGYLGQYNNNVIACSISNSTISAYTSAGIVASFGTNNSTFNFEQNSIAGCYTAADVKLIGNRGNAFAAGIVGATYGYVYGCYSLTSLISDAGWVGNQNSSLIGKFTEFSDSTEPYLYGTDFLQECYTTVSSLPALYYWSGYNNGSWVTPTYDIPTVNTSGNSIVVSSISATEVEAMNSAIKTATDKLSLGYTYQYKASTTGSSFPYVIKKEY